MSGPIERYETEAPSPEAPTLREAVRYVFDEIERRAYQTTKGLTDADLNHDPGHGAMSLGELLHHQLQLVRFLIHHLDRGALEDLPIPAEVGGEADGWRIAPILAYREMLNERFRQVFASTTDDILMSKRPDLFPEEWGAFPILMRVLRPMTDIATHVGQVAYARRQLGKPMPPDPIRDRARR